MPMVQINMIKGRTKEQMEELIKEVSMNVSEIAVCPLSTVHVIINEVEMDHWGREGETIKKRIEKNCYPRNL